MNRMFVRAGSLLYLALFLTTLCWSITFQHWRIAAATAIMFVVLALMFWHLWSGEDV